MKPVVESEAPRVFGFLRKLRAEPGKQKAPLHRVFELLDLEGRSAVETAAALSAEVRAVADHGAHQDARRTFGMSQESGELGGGHPGHGNPR